MELQLELSKVLSRERVLTSPLQRIAYANDASYFRLIPHAVVQPNSIGEIQALFRFSQQKKIPMTFRAAGTSLSGQAVTDGILVDISKHWGRYRVEKDGALICFQPGIVGAFLNNVLKPYGRRIGPDPASIDACMMGGILANNSSGMCCGITENAYRTISSMAFVLPNGLFIDTAASDAAAQLHEGAPEIESGLFELKRRLLADTELTARVRRRYRMKNNNGYLLNAFIDFDAPLDILTHLLIGSEGTLGFIAEAVLYTLPDYPHKYTGQLYFKTVQDAAAAIYPLRESGARAAEIMDRASLHSVENLPGAPAIVAQLPETAAAILVEYQAEDGETSNRFQKAAQKTLSDLRLLHDAEFTAEANLQALLWKLRKGIIPSVGAMRPPATTLLTEDVVFPVPHLAEAVTDLQQLFDKHGYADGVVFGHAKDGNLHFLIAQSFNTESDIQRFSRFTDDLVKIVSGKYDGALKAEHGTGRNMTPFVETEWGANAYNIMCDLKSLLDPSGMLNPGVVINPNPQAHITHVKSMANVAPEVDKCIECGFCESKCPSRRLTLTPRQRIVVQREISSLKTFGSGSQWLTSLISDYHYAGNDTCAVDGMCATACPVNINTGDLTKRLRTESVSPSGEKIALWLAKHFPVVENAVGLAVRMGHIADRISGTRWYSILPAVEKLTGLPFPKWNAHIPYPSGNLRALKGFNSSAQFVYFPSCISRQLGIPTSLVSAHASLADTLTILARRANVSLRIPPDVEGTCCGMPFSSKGYFAAYQTTLHKTIQKFWRWTDGGKLPIFCDTTSCIHTLRTCYDALSDDDEVLYRQMTILDSIEFIHDTLIPRLDIDPIAEDVVLHPNCSARKLGLQDKLAAIARKCARTVTIPLNLDCCAFAGDRGLLFPELTASATAKETTEVNFREYGGYYSSNITCEIGMSEATGRDYVAIVYLVERATR